jgi:hypothetical protein
MADSTTFDVGETRCAAIQPTGSLPAWHNDEECPAAALGRANRRASACQKFIDRPDPDIGITTDATFAIITTVCDGSVAWSTSTTDLFKVVLSSILALSRLDRRWDVVGHGGRSCTAP